jgi:hypothetical protein
MLVDNFLDMVMIQQFLNLGYNSTATNIYQIPTKFPFKFKISHTIH